MIDQTEIITKNLTTLISDISQYAQESQHLLIDLATHLPDVEQDIEENILEARELLDFVFSDTNTNTSYGVRNELNRFQNQLNLSLQSLKDSERLDSTLFNEVEEAVSLSQKTTNNIEDIYDISENLKVFAINSIVFSQKEGEKGKGYQIISTEFIRLSEKIAMESESIRVMGQEMNLQVSDVIKLIKEHELYQKENFTAISADSLDLIRISNDSVSNFTRILKDMLNRIESVKSPISGIMTELQKEDIIKQQIDHLSEGINDILAVVDYKSAFLTDKGLDGMNDENKSELISLFSLLYYLSLNVEKQMDRINYDLTSMVDDIETRFNLLKDNINDIDNDQLALKQLVIDEENENQVGSIIQLIFKKPQNTIDHFITGIEEMNHQKERITDTFVKINSMVAQETDRIQMLVPVVESINNLLLLARIEQARYSLAHEIFTHKTFERLNDILEDSSLARDKVNQNLDRIVAGFDAQKLKYESMKKSLSESVVILQQTEDLFIDNYKTIMGITEQLSGELNRYIDLFYQLKQNQLLLKEKTGFSRESQKIIQNMLTPLGGVIPLKQCLFQDVFIEKIVKRCSVEAERITLKKEIHGIDIEESQQDGITLF